MELLDIYDDLGNKTEKTIQRDKVKELGENEHIAVGVIFIENNEGKFLIQKTSELKGGLFSSTGGHITTGEKPLNSIKREVEEEIGINIDNDNVLDLGYIMYDLLIRFMFYLKKDINIKSIKVQKDEVDYLVYMTEDEIIALIDNNLITKSHGIIFKKILEYRKGLL